MLVDYKRQFIEFALDHDVLRFGEFDLKSGRRSPYFFNAGEFKTGAALARLGSYYAEVLVRSELAADCLFGPAYKGIPLVRPLPSRWQIYIKLIYPMFSTARRQKAMVKVERSLARGWRERWLLSMT